MFPHVAEENLGPFCRVLCTVLTVGKVTTRMAYDRAESKCKDLGQFYHANKAGDLCWTALL